MSFLPHLSLLKFACRFFVPQCLFLSIAGSWTVCPCLQQFDQQNKKAHILCRIREQSRLPSFSILIRNSVPEHLLQQLQQLSGLQGRCGPGTASPRTSCSSSPPGHEPCPAGQINKLDSSILSTTFIVQESGSLKKKQKTIDVFS